MVVAVSDSESCSAVSKIRSKSPARSASVISTDTGASVYVNTLADHAEEVESRIAEIGIDTDIWEVGGPARVLDESDALF
ncbi:hypothetical protein DJ71_00565 [Halorubrum sp. E3]|nr:hypothetical protein DJ71_00565 [Halorubrum sp. E3]